jgi:hypothetical protein
MMRSGASFATTVAVAFVLSGCLRTTAIDSAASPERSGGVVEVPKVRPWAHFFVLGTLGEKNVDVRSACGDAGATRIQTYDDVLTILITFTSLGIYTPRRVEVTCASGADAKQASK